MASYLVSIDPGLRGSGVALFENKRLVAATYVRNPEQKARGPVAWIEMAGSVAFYIGKHQIETLVMEMPQIYRERFWKGDPADLLELTGCLGAICDRVHAQTSVFKNYLPREWKKTVPKPIHNERVMARLDVGEVEAMDKKVAKGLVHNVIDGIGIGLHHLGRL